MAYPGIQPAVFLHTGSIGKLDHSLDEPVDVLLAPKWLPDGLSALFAREPRHPIRLGSTNRHTTHRFISDRHQQGMLENYFGMLQLFSSFFDVLRHNFLGGNSGTCFVQIMHALVHLPSGEHAKAACWLQLLCPQGVIAGLLMTRAPRRLLCLKDRLPCSIFKRILASEGTMAICVLVQRGVTARDKAVLSFIAETSIHHKLLLAMCMASRR